MKKKMGLVLFLSTVLLFMACGTAIDDEKSSSGIRDVGKLEEDDPKVEREIIAKLEQTVTETPKRDAVAKEQTESYEFKEGLFGEPSSELAEDMAVQAIEGPAAIEAAEKVYGGHVGIDKVGILFFENQASGAKQSGIWLGIKEPDERLDELLAILQPKVDAGEILAKPIYIFKSDHTRAELNQLQDDVMKVLKPMVDERGSYGVSVNTITGDIEISHDFLKEEQQQELREKFAAHTIHFKQEGSMIAEPGQPMTTLPEEKYTTTPSLEGEYVMHVDEKRMLIVGTEPYDFSSTGGQNEFYSAAYYEYPEVDKLKVGQRVHVEMTGMMMDSYPGQGRAKYVEVLPEYKPENAKLSESEVIQKAIGKKKSNDMIIIRSLKFDEKTAVWKVGVKQGAEEYELEIKDA